MAGGCMGMRTVIGGGALLLMGAAIGHFIAGQLESRASRPAVEALAAEPAEGEATGPWVEDAEGARGGRIVVSLTADEREHISGEMLAFLQGVQQIGEASLVGDRETIATVADGLRRDAGSAAGRSIQQKAPEGFTQMSRMLRQDFGAISDMAMTVPMPDVQQALFDTMVKCASCHGSYGVVESAR